MISKGMLGSAALAAIVFVAPAHGVDLETAKKMADACQAKAVAEGWKMNVAVVDAGADLVLFQRMDGAFLGSIEIAQMKAESSALFPFPTRGLGEIAFGKDGEPGRTPGFAFVPGLAAFPGGLPVKTKGGAHIGAIGVSGGTGDQDEACAQTALDAVADQLK
ncbi:MAG: GlcG/HbpS family heme-binding protein [Geminicoccaceae bacterium]